MNYSIQSLRSLLPVYKPKGWTSNDVVRKVKGVMKRSTPSEIRVGHGGTLDPMAEGVLVLGLGKGTKELKKFLSGRKVYRAKAVFGQSTDTLDATGSVNGVMEHSFVTKDLIESHILQFKGLIQQTPPMYSSLKVNGIRLYNYARRGISIERSPREVLVHHISMIDACPPFWAQFEIDCEGGFYVRSFIDDLAKSIGTKAYMSELIRISHGQINISDCLYLEGRGELELDSILKKQIVMP